MKTQKSTFRKIKTFEQACAVLDRDPSKEMAELAKYLRSRKIDRRTAKGKAAAEKVKIAKQLNIIAEALNEEPMSPIGTPQLKFYCWFSGAQEFRFGGIGEVRLFDIPSYNSKHIAEYAAKNFKQMYNTLLDIN